MKKSLIAVASIVALSVGYTFAADTTQWDPTLHQATSCTEVESVITSYLKNNWSAGQYMPMVKGGIMNDAVSAVAAPTAGMESKSSDMGMGGGGSDFSTTNVQKDGVDEPEIIKTNGVYIYYLDQSKGILHVLNPKDQTEVTSIVLPKDYRNTQLLLNGNKLVLVGSKSLPYYQARYEASFVSRDQQSLIAVYSISQPTPKLIQAYTFDGYLQDSRIVDNQLVLVSSQSMSRGPIYKMATIGSISATDISKVSIHAEDVLPKWSMLTYGKITNKNGTTKVVTRKKTTAIDCTQLMFKKPDPLQKNTHMYGGESLTTIVRLSLSDADAKPQMKTILGNSSQIHVSKKSIYMTAPTYMRQPFVCPMNAMCLPWRGEGQYTTIYGFSIDGLKYNYATVVNGNTRNQYSMDENSTGKFRIVTSNWVDGKNSTNVYVVDVHGNVGGKIEKIAPGEQFYGVRFIGDYLYLVTYKQVDPLFVIDTSTNTPSIIGQLKMPGYSTYLHPYGALKDGVQYLIGLGYDIKTTPEGWEQQQGIKLDLYKIDYNKKDAKGQVAVTQEWTKSLGSAGSQSDALNNPRMFVFNQTTKELILPIVLADTKKVQSCNVVYDMDGKEIRKDCYPYDQAVTTFAGVKSWILGIDQPTEKLSVDYKSLIKNPYPGDMVKPMEGGVVSTNSADAFVDPRWFSALQGRVGYIDSQYYFVGNQFANFFTKGDQKGVMLNFK